MNRKKRLGVSIAAGLLCAAIFSLDSRPSRGQTFGGGTPEGGGAAVGGAGVGSGGQGGAGVGGAAQGWGGAGVGGAAQGGAGQGGAGATSTGQGGTSGGATMSESTATETVIFGGGGEGGSGGGSTSQSGCPVTGVGAVKAGMPAPHETGILNLHRNYRFGVDVGGVPLSYDSARSSESSAYGGAGWDLGLATLSVLADGTVVIREGLAESRFTPLPGGGYEGEVAETRQLVLSNGTFELVHEGGRARLFQNGRETTWVEPHGTLRSYTYDASGRLASIDLPPSATTITLAYDASGNLASVSDGHMSQTLTYDAEGRLSAVGQAVTIGAPSGGPPLIAFGYDPTSHRMTQVVNSMGETTQVWYGPDGGVTHVIQPDTTTFLYGCSTDAGGRLVLSAVDSFGNEIKQIHDASGSIVETIDASGNATVYARDAHHRITSITEDGLTTTMTYSPGHDLSSITGPDGQTITMTYDASHRMTSRVDALGRAETFTYDALGITSYKDTFNRTYHYDRTATGDVWRERTPDGLSVTYTHDSRGRVMSITGPDGLTTSVDRSPAGEVTAIHYPDGTSESFSLAPDGAVVSSTDRLGRTTGYAYDDRRQVSQVSLPGGGNKHISVARDSMGRVTGSQVALGPKTMTMQRSFGLNSEVATRQINGVWSQVGPRTHAPLPMPPGGAP